MHSAHKAFIPMDETLYCVAVTLEIYRTKLFNAIMAGNASNKYGLGKLRFDEEVPVRLSE